MNSVIDKLTDIILDIEQGDINPLDVFRTLKKDIEDINKLFDRIKEMSIIDADSRSKMELEGLGYELRNGKRIFDFSANKDHAKMKADIKALEMILKEGELVPVKYAKQSLIVKRLRK